MPPPITITRGLPVPGDGVGAGVGVGVGLTPFDFFSSANASGEAVASKTPPTDKKYLLSMMELLMNGGLALG
jgi:hypothetical protein